jgi:hypothetical protein
MQAQVTSRARAEAVAVPADTSRPGKSDKPPSSQEVWHVFQLGDGKRDRPRRPIGVWHVFQVAGNRTAASEVARER